MANSGIGIKPENQKQLFKIDSGYSTPGTKNEQGTGLGLVLCREFVECHGGIIWAESTPVEGTHFYFSILNKEN